MIVSIDLDKKLDQQLPDYLRALWTYATPLCIRFVFISFVEECLNIVHKTGSKQHAHGR